MFSEYIDNEMTTMAAAITDYIEHLKIDRSGPVSLSVATGYFHPGVFSMLEQSLRKLGHFRLLIGADPLPDRMCRPSRDEPGDRFEVSDDDINNSIEDDQIYERDMLEVVKETKENVMNMVSFFRDGMEAGRVEVRKYTKKFLHGKAYIFMDNDSCIVGSSNFTPAGLQCNCELNLGRRDSGVVGNVKNWFDRLWDQSEEFDIAKYYDDKFKLTDPYLVWIKTLWELYGDELAEEGRDVNKGKIVLSDFQSDGLHRAKKIMDKYNGVIIADSVGLGKTFLAGKLIEETSIMNRQRTLILTPASLRDTTWDRFMKEKDIRVECKSFQELRLGNLDAEPNEYSLIVIDEAAAFRNDGTEQSKALINILKGTPPKKVMMMTATPVNNSLWDLYTLLSYFIKNDAAFSDKGILSMRKKFQEAENEDPFSLSPNVLFDILDETTVRRTRKFIKKWYEGDTISDKGGVSFKIVFPRTEVSTIDYIFSEEMDYILERFMEAMEDESEGLTFARYGWKKYAIDSDMYDSTDLLSQIKVSGLIRSSLLKRLESSLYSFSKTLQKMISSFGKFIKGLENGKILDAEKISKMEDDLTDEEIESLIEEESSAESALGLDVERLIADVKKDIGILLSIDETVSRYIETQNNDPKLNALLGEVKKILKESRGKEHESDLRKILLFSFYEDTVDWIRDWLTRKAKEDPELSVYDGRIVSVSGSTSKNDKTMSKIVGGFSPETAKDSFNPKDNLYDILITTDVLSEGQNLQQCANIINYDLPWNPMRLVQRQGRVDRLKSKHITVYSRCFMPGKRLEELLDLERRIKIKIAKAAQSIGVEDEIIPGGLTSDLVYAELKEEIERIAEGNSKIFENAGEGTHSGSGEEFRRELQKALEEYPEECLEKVPWGVGSCIVGREPGFFFCSRVGRHVFLRFVPKSGSIRSKKLECLTSAMCTRDTPLREEFYPQEIFGYWEKAKKHIFEEWIKGTSLNEVMPEVRKKFRYMADLIECHPPSGMTTEEIENYGKTLRAPYPPRIEKEFPSLSEMRREQSKKKLEIYSKMIIDKCNELGLEPYNTHLLNKIEESDVKLICWIKVM